MSNFLCGIIIGIIIGMAIMVITGIKLKSEIIVSALILVGFGFYNEEFINILLNYSKITFFQEYTPEKIIFWITCIINIIQVAFYMERIGISIEER